MSTIPKFILNRNGSGNGNASGVILNVNTYNNQPTAYATKILGRKAVPLALRQYGLIITYLYNDTDLNTDVWISEQYIGTDTIPITDGYWSANSRWAKIETSPFERGNILFNVNGYYGARTTNYTLSQAISMVPDEYRFTARAITFRSSDGVKLAIFNENNNVSGWTTEANWVVFDKNVIDNINTLDSSIGNLSNLTTSQKNDIVSAINEVFYSCVRKSLTKTIHASDNLLTQVGSGTNWSASDGGVYTHTPGSDAILEFPFETDSSKNYLLKIRNGENGEDFIQAAVGDSPYVDTYWGSASEYRYFGFKGNGGRLKLKPISSYSSTVEVELLEITDENSAYQSIVLSVKNVDDSVMTNDLTNTWVVAIGADNTLSQAQNITRTVAIGHNSMSKIVTGDRNIALGTFTMANMNEGDKNIAIGADSIMYAKKANECVAIGKGTFNNRTNNSLDEITRNVAIGNHAINHNSIAASENVAIGSFSGLYADKQNVAIGANAYNHCKILNGVKTAEDSGLGNIAIGYRSMYWQGVTGNYNIALGYKAQIGNTGNHSTSANYDYSIAIGYNAAVDASNTIAIGNTDNITGTSTPIYSKMEIRLGAGGELSVKVGSNEYILEFNNDNTVTWKTPTT